MSNSIYCAKTPRVAMYIWRLQPVIGGAEKQCKILSEELTKKGIPIFIVTERIKNTKRFELINNVRVYRVGSLDLLRRLPGCIKRLKRNYQPAPDGHNKLHNKFKAAKLISIFLSNIVPNCYFFLTSLWLFYKKRNEFDIIHIHEAHWIAAFGVKIANMLGKKAVVKETISGELMTFRMQPFRLQRKVLEADFFAAVSNEIFSDLISIGISREKIIKIPNGVCISATKWQFNDCAERTVVCLSKINQLPDKGIDVLLNAWAIVRKRCNKTIKLQILGRGSPLLLEGLIERLDIKEDVHFPGFVENVGDYLLNSCVFVVPSRGEGLSNALLEAMSLGLPCVATDISGNQDVIRMRENGLLVPSGDPKAMAEAILFMLNNPTEAIRMGRNARETIEKGYAISMVADKYAQIYKETITGERA